MNRWVSNWFCRLLLMLACGHAILLQAFRASACADANCKDRCDLFYVWKNATNKKSYVFSFNVMPAKMPNGTFANSQCVNTLQPAPYGENSSLEDYSLYNPHYPLCPSAPWSPSDYVRGEKSQGGGLWPVFTSCYTGSSSGK